MNLCEGPLLKKIIIYTIPIILTGMLQLLFNAADLMVVGRFCGSRSVAAVGATGSLINLLINAFIGLSVGSGVSVAQGLGANDNEDVYRVVHTTIPVAILGGAVLTVVGVLGAESFLRGMGTPENVLKLSVIYLQVYFCGMIPSMLYNFGAAILRAAGDTRGPLVYLTLAGFLNVGLNVLFVTALQMDVAGVALATVFSQTLSAVLILFALVKRTDACHLSLRSMHIYRKQLGKILRIGLPAGLQSTLFNISNVLVTASVNSFGEVAMSGSAAAGNIEGFLYVAVNAFHQTSLNFIGQNKGAKKYDRIGRVIGISLVLVTVVAVVLGVTAYVFARPLLSLYITDSEEAIGFGISRMTYIVLLYFLCGLMDVMTGALRGLGVSVEPLVITVLGVCGVRIAWIYTVFPMPAYHTLGFLFLSYPVSWGITFLAEGVAFLLVYRRMKKNGEWQSG